MEAKIFILVMCSALLFVKSIRKLDLYITQNSGLWAFKRVFTRISVCRLHQILMLASTLLTTACVYMKQKM